MQTLEFTKTALARSTKAVTLRPQKGQYTHTNSAVIENGTACFVREKKFQMLVDVPPSIGGGGAGPTPGTLVRSALTSCIAIGVKLWAARADMQIDYVDVQLEADVDARGEMGVDDDIAPGFLVTRLIISVRTNAPKEDVEKVITRSLKYSPLFDIYSNPQNIALTLDIAKNDDQDFGGAYSDEKLRYA